MSKLVHSQVKLYRFLFLVRTDSPPLESEAAHRYMSRCAKLSLTQRTQSLEVALHINVERNKQNAMTKRYELSYILNEVILVYLQRIDYFRKLRLWYCLRLSGQSELALMSISGRLSNVWLLASTIVSYLTTSSDACHLSHFTATDLPQSESRSRIHRIRQRKIRQYLSSLLK